MKKFVVIFLTLLTVIITLTGCGRGGYEQNDNSCSYNEETMLSLDTGKLYHPFGSDSIVYGVNHLNNKLFITGSVLDEPLLGIAEFVVSNTGDISISETKIINLGISEVGIRGTAVAGNYFYLLLEKVPKALINNNETSWQSEFKGQLIIQKYSNSGELLDLMSINEWHTDYIHGFAAANDGKLVIYGSSYISILYWNQDNVNIYTDSIDSDGYLLTVTLVGDNLIATVYAPFVQTTSYYLIDSVTGAFSRIDFAGIDDKGLIAEGYFWIEELGLYFTNFNLSGGILYSVSQSERGINILGIITQTQSVYAEYIVNDGFRFFALCLDTGAREKLYQWNYDMGEVTSCTSVTRINENILVYTIRNKGYLFITQRHDYIS